MSIWIDDVPWAGYNLCMYRFRPEWTAAVLVAAMLTASPLVSPAVLCVGEDGHVALESTEGGLLSDCRNCHSEALETVLPERRSQFSGVDSCGACRDFSVYCERCLPSSGDSLGRIGWMPNFVTTAQGNPRVDDRLRNASLFSRSFTEFGKIPILAAHRTVVLLC